MQRRLSPAQAHSARLMPGSLRHVRLHWQAAHTLRQAPDSPVSTLADRLPSSEIAWHDFETAPIVASLPARPYVPSIQNRLAQLRRKPATRCQSPNCANAARDASAAQPRPSSSLDCSNERNCRSAAATNAAQHILDSLLSRNLLRQKLIPFRRAPLRPRPDLARSSDRARDVARAVGTSGLDSSSCNRIFWPVATLDRRLLPKFGLNPVMP